MSASRRKVSDAVTRVELRTSLESVLGHLDVSRLPDGSREQVGERAEQPAGSSGSGLFVLVEHARFLPTLGVHALKARLHWIRNPLIASEVTRGLSIADRGVPLQVYIYEENGATVLLTHDQSSSLLTTKEVTKNAPTSA